MIIILLLYECVEFICFRRVLKFSIRLFKGTDGQSKVILTLGSLHIPFILTSLAFYHNDSDRHSTTVRKHRDLVANNQLSVRI